MSSSSSSYNSDSIRLFLKLVRDDTKTAYDTLPSGEEIGSFANKHAISVYTRITENKRLRARESRRKKKTDNKSHGSNVY